MQTIYDGGDLIAGTWQMGRIRRSSHYSIGGVAVERVMDGCARINDPAGRRPGVGRAERLHIKPVRFF